MTTIPPAKPLVRPGFLKWSTAAVLLLVPLVAYTMWDYVEERRVAVRVEAIERSGAPTTTYFNHELTGAAIDADRYYRAAATLAGTFRLPGTPQAAYRVNAAMRDGRWTPDLLVDLRTRVDDYRDALALADRAAPLPFDGVAPGWSFSYFVSGLMSLSRLCELRAMEAALDGHGDAAFDSLYSDARIGRVLGRPPQFTGLNAIVARAKPSAASRQRLAQALADLDRDDFMAQAFVHLRAVALTSVAPLRAPLGRPWIDHRIASELDDFAALIAAAQRPTAERSDTIRAVGRWPSFFSLSTDRSRETLNHYVATLEADAERVRCARRLVAGEMVNCQR